MPTKENVMQIRTIRKVGIAVASTSLALTLSGCAAGNDAPTRMTTQVTDGVDGSINTYGSDIRVKSALIVAQPDGFWRFGRNDYQWKFT